MPVESLPVVQHPTVDGWMRGDPVGEQSCRVGMQRDVAVVVEFADRDPEPGCAVELDDRVTLERAEFTGAHPGPRQQLDYEPIERGSDRGCGGEAGGLDVVEEPWQRVVRNGDINGEDRDPHRCVVPVPLDDPIEEAAQHPETLPDRVARWGFAGRGDVGDEEQFELFDMDAANIDEPGQFGVCGDDEPCEASQRVVRDIDGRGSHRHGQLIEITPGSGSEHWRVRDHQVPIAVTQRTVRARIVDGVSERSGGAHLRIPTDASIRSLAR
jgi:hypothetical protein